MDDAQKNRRIYITRLSAIAALCLVYFFLVYYFNFVLRADIVYNHFAYIPIILAGLWWGRKCVYVALLLGMMLIAVQFFHIRNGELWPDIARTVFFVIIALFTGTLSESLIASRKALRVSEKKYKQIINKSLAGIFVYREGRMLFSNSRFADMVGYSAKEMVGMSIWDLFHEQDLPLVRELAEKRVSAGLTDLYYQCRFVGRTGKVVWADVASSIADYEGEDSILVNVYDITAKRDASEKQYELSELTRKQEEQLVHSTRLAELGEMAAGIAHELNQPLTGIRNFARNAFYMLEQDVGSRDEIKDNLRLISEQVDRSAKIINQMRELTRKSERQFVAHNLNDLVRESLEFLMPQMKLSGVQVSSDMKDGLPQVMGDRIRLEQVFLNIMTNARQAMEEAEERKLSVRTYSEGGNGREFVCVEMRDTGKGFSQSDSLKLFAPFYTTKKTGQGTGLGLSISYSIIKEHGGVIEAEGEEGKGALFRIKLPPAKKENSGADAEKQ